MHFVKNISITLATNVTVTAATILNSIVLARVLGPEGRGLMTTILIWPQVISWLFGLSLGFANTYYGAADPGLRRRLFANSFWFGLLVGGVSGIIAAICLPYFIRLTPLQHLLLVINLMVLPIGLWWDTAAALLQSSNRFDRLGIVRVAVPLLITAALVILWAAHSLTVMTAIVANWVAGWLILGLLVRFLALGGFGGLRPDGTLLRRCLAYSVRVHGGTLANLANGRLDQLIMTVMIAPKALGLYAFAVTTSEMLNQIATAVSLVLLPRMAAESQQATQAEVAIRSVKWVFLIGTTGAAVLFWLAPPLVNLLWGHRFLEAVPTTRILLPGTVALGVAGILTTSLRGAGRPVAGTVAEVVSLVVMVPLLLLLLPRMGIFGAGIASTCGYCVNCVVALLFFANTFGGKCLLGLRPSFNDLREIQARLTRSHTTTLPEAPHAG